MEELIKEIDELKKGAEAVCDETRKKIDARDGDITALYVDLGIYTGKYLAYSTVLDLLYAKAVAR